MNADEPNIYAELLKRVAAQPDKTYLVVAFNSFECEYAAASFHKFFKEGTYPLKAENRWRFRTTSGGCVVFQPARQPLAGIRAQGIVFLPDAHSAVPSGEVAAALNPGGWAIQTRSFNCKLHWRPLPSWCPFIHGYF